MIAKPIALLLLLTAVPLGGCVAGIAASAAGMAVRSAQAERQGNRHLQPLARTACSAHAAQFGTVHIIDVEQRSAGTVIVWGTVADASGRRSFECAFTHRIAGFKLRAIKTQN
jgi:hypothetical protein